MDDTLINQGFLWFFGALFVGPLAGWLVHFVGGFERGVAVGCLVIGLTGSTMAVLVGFDRARQLEGMVAVEGRLVGFDGVRTKDSEGRATVSYEPQVVFVTADGQEYAVKGLGGSQQSKAEGDTVPVRYRPDDPGAAVIADFQNQWGGVLAFGIFGGFPLLFGLFFLGVGASKNGKGKTAPQRRPRVDPVRAAWALNCIRAGNVTLLLSFIGMGISRYDVMPTVAGGFCGVALAMLIFIVGVALRPDRDWQSIGILLILMIGFAVFGIGGLILGLEV